MCTAGMGVDMGMGADTGIGIDRYGGAITELEALDRGERMVWPGQ